jgi:imidazolonepropionase-like amidohydrolase
MARTVLRGGRVLDVDAGTLHDADVVIEGGRIVEVGAGLDGDEAVDCSGRALLPGLVDCHVHVMLDPGWMDLATRVNTPWSLPYFKAAHHLRATLGQGITTVRDAGLADLGVKVAVERGLVAGPRMQISIQMLSQTGGHGDMWTVCGLHLDEMATHPGIPGALVDGPDEMRRRVREMIRAGADVIKVCTSGGVLSPRDDPRHGHFRDSELAVLAEETKAAGIPWMAHAAASEGIKAAVRNGVRSIEHGIFLDDEAIGMMLERGTWLVPTLVAPRGVLAARDAGIPVPDVYIEKAEMVVEVHRESFRRAVDAGVRVAMGTDSGVTPHGRNLEELALMAEYGMAPADVLRATTRSAAALLRLDDEIGAIEPGKRADVVVVDGDPLDVATLGSRIAEVWQDGRRVV